MRELILTRSSTDARAARPPLLPLTTDALGYRAGDARLIDDVSLRITATRCTAILGYNGAGKSVLLRLLHGLLQPTAGAVRWDGRTVASDPHIANRQAMVFQSPTLLRRSVAANIRFALARRGYRGTRLKERLAEVLAATNLTALAGRQAGVLSGGERQRVALARALAAEPDIVFLDEPTASLDPAATIAIEEILANVAAAGVKLVLVTQSVTQAARLADDVIFLHHGRVTEHTPIDEFRRAPRSAAAAAFVAGRLFA